ncbi:MAG TPA: RagB/SusD family nutrient uptake outer membrane protein [Hanamia sp.]|nr:RagB/SusD family nutrient uptake outer membrane protein [Hanamia sp.]
MKNIFLSIAGFAIVAITINGCNKDLNRSPANTVTVNQVYSTPEGYTQAMAKVYGAFALTSSTGPAASDVQGIDAGTSDFLRLFWNTQELTTDEAVCAWNDPGVPDFHNMNWSSNNPILLGLYTRSIYQITVCNDFLRNSTDAILSSKGFQASDVTNIKYYRAEARFLRAYQYWVLMDEFANPPFITDSLAVGSIPKQIDRKDLFNYIESELLSCSANMAPPRTNQYGRADQAAAWALLARLYLNAEVYTGTARYTDAITYAEKVINSGYSLDPSYQDLFLADNNVNNPEVILPIEYDGNNTQTYGGTTFIINGEINAGMNPALFGVPSGGWGGNRATSAFAALFPSLDTTIDKRAIFYGTNTKILDVTNFDQGAQVVKFKNITSTGATPPGGGTFCSTDFPLFRLAEQYLIYAEAVLRGGTGGDINTAVGYINLLRERAYGNTSGNITAADLTLPFILNERGRELWWECFRRTDLIRFGEFTTSDYLWPWKGGISNGTGVSSQYNIFPIPLSDIQANPYLVQNPGY